MKNFFNYTTVYKISTYQNWECSINLAFLTFEEASWLCDCTAASERYGEMESGKKCLYISIYSLKNCKNPQNKQKEKKINCQNMKWLIRL